MPIIWVVDDTDDCRCGKTLRVQQRCRETRLPTCHVVPHFRLQVVDTISSTYSFPFVNHHYPSFLGHCSLLWSAASQTPTSELLTILALRPLRTESDISYTITAWTLLHKRQQQPAEFPTFTPFDIKEGRRYGYATYIYACWEYWRGEPPILFLFALLVSGWGWDDGIYSRYGQEDGSEEEFGGPGFTVELAHSALTSLSHLQFNIPFAHILTSELSLLNSLYFCIRWIWIPQQIRNELRAGFASGKLKSIAYRKYQLTQLIYMIKDNMTRFEESLNADLGRPVLECRMLVPLHSSYWYFSLKGPRLYVGSKSSLLLVKSRSRSAVLISGPSRPSPLLVSTSPLCVPLSVMKRRELCWLLVRLIIQFG